jgi:hypothetical protein
LIGKKFILGHETHPAHLPKFCQLHHAPGIFSPPEPGYNYSAVDKKLTPKQLYNRSERGKARFDAYNRRPKGRYRTGKQNAIKRNIPFHITLEEYEILIQSETCSYCMGPLDEAGLGLDRKNNAIPYQMDNVVTCCGECNSIKGKHLSHDEMVVIAATIKALRKISA